MGDQIRFVDDNTDTRLAGELVDDGATVGDVLTVQADGSIAAQTGGGSLPVEWTVGADGSLQIVPTDTAPALTIDSDATQDAVQLRDAGGTRYANAGTSLIGSVVPVIIETRSGEVQAALQVASDEVAQNAIEAWDTGFNNLKFFVTSDGHTTMIPPTSDPHIVGALYNLAGVPTISAG